MKEVDLGKFDNSWYNPGSFLKRFFWHVISNAFINSTLPLPMKIKILILRLFGAKVGHNVTIKPSVNIKYPWFLTIKDNVWIGEKVWIDNFVDVLIEPNVCISQGALLLTGNHNYSKETFDLMPGKIVLERGSWVGAKTVVCPGITLKTHSVLAVGSVATKDLNAFSVYQGNPAVWVRDRKIEDDFSVE
ncbi:WcaF family extracellular polysaccharide biosynthesis acetyltransferase [Lacihabitans soyangensis]|uniref:Colanic acid biosynthesis acetyltransferase WcaF n=1 Tax=Lacihabitans soyangensis TaxID=869394 RepID=A0AAE3H536_9BACT|nr:WcaF family extracellular polysaccharide biosynthesis acetyltransferase [Lacihabitans soyangensis]MCP9765073.1 colanic acid biosynthesis acetyltransferase WcaF [Lacihabitans soyangensis]